MVTKAMAAASMFSLPVGGKIWDTLPTRDGTYTIRTSALAGAARPEGLSATNREAGIRTAVQRGNKLDAIDVTKGLREHGGKLEISDGNNRMHVARERGEPVVRVNLSVWTRALWKKHFGP